MRLLVLFLFAFAFAAQGATFGWTGLGGDSFWSTGSNWSGDVAPGAGDDLVFPGGSVTTNINDLAVTFNSITLHRDGWLLQGAPIHVSNGITTTQSAGTSRVSALVVTATPQTFTVFAGGSTLRFSTGIDNSGVLTFDGHGTFLIDGVISGPGSVVKNGPGVLLLEGINTFTGGLTLNPGTDPAAGPGTLAGSGVVGNIVQNGGILSAGTTLADPTLTTGNLTLAGGIVQLVMISPAVVQQLDVDGTVTLTNSSLTFGFNAPNTPAPGTVLTIVDNDGADPVAGTFNGLPEGQIFTAAGRTFRISYVGGDGNDITLVATEADLGVTKVADDTTPTVGQNVTYTITVTNAGPAEATGVTLTDNLGAGLTFVSATPSQGSCSGTGPVTCNLGTINNGANATVTLIATASTAGPLTNTAIVAGADSDTNSANDSDVETVTAGAAAPIAAVPALDARALAALALLLVVAGAFMLRSCCRAGFSPPPPPERRAEARPTF